MNLRKALLTAAAGLAISLGASQASAQAVSCSTINTIGGWAAAGRCIQGDKLWVYTSRSDSLGAAVQVIFSSGDPLEHTMQIVGFDNGLLPGLWNIKYDIAVLDPDFYIAAMFAGADQPVDSSLLTKAVTGDPGGAFGLAVVNGVEGPASGKLGLHASLLTIDETFSVAAGGILVSVSNTYVQQQRQAPIPGTLALLGLGMVALGMSRRRKFS